MHITIQELKDQFDALLSRCEAGEELIVTRDGKPVVRIKPEPAPRTGERPPPGLMKGTIKYMSPDFDAPMMLVDDPEFAPKPPINTPDAMQRDDHLGSQAEPRS